MTSFTQEENFEVFFSYYSVLYVAHALEERQVERRSWGYPLASQVDQYPERR